MTYTKTQDLRGQDLIDSRDVIARIEELDSYRDTALDGAAELQERIDELEAQPELTTDESEELSSLRCSIWDGDWFGQDESYQECSDWGENTAEELKALLSLQSEADGSPDWYHGEGLIKDSYFVEYAQELAEDIGAINRGVGWPNNHIDWEAAADALKVDYFSVTFDGEEYWIRA